MSRPVWNLVVARLVAALAAALALAALALLASRAHAETIAFTGGTVHTVSGADIAGGTVIVRDGRIAAVGAGVPVPGDATVVRCDGKQIYPGMVSANTVVGLIEIESVRGTYDAAETGTINPNVRAEVGVNPESEEIPVTRVNGVTSALVIPRGGAITGTSALIHLDGWTWEDMTLRAPVGLHVIWPSMTPVHGFFERRSDEEQIKARDSTIAAIGKAFDDARAYEHAVAAESQKGIPRHDRDVKWDAMRKAIRGELPVFFHASTLAQIRAVLKLVDEQKLAKVVLVGGYDAWRVTDELKARDIAVICDPTLEVPRRRYEPYDAAYTLPAKLAAAGVRFCIADGAGGGEGLSASNARNLPYNAGMAAAFGLPRDEALKGVTLYPAQILGVGDRLGSIEPGKIADLVVTRGDLLDETTTVDQVYIAGKAISMETRQTRLFHKYDSRPRGPKARPH
jgi:imidazolonepropionase-like amidohydrolase